MEDLVERLRHDAGVASALSLDRYLKIRNILEKRANPNIGYDGHIEPIGTAFADGFRLVINDAASSIRQRFTVAHEICHTYFYEIVPEIKFRPHARDSFEEALCNHGAAALLMPAEDVLLHVKSRDVSLDTLEELSRRYAVSLEAAFLRLRGMRLWNCEMTVWHRMTTGEFALDKVHGWLKVDWRWADSSIPGKAWSQENSRPLSGRSFVYFERPDGYSAAAPVYFEAKRRGDSLVALWGAKRLAKVKKPPGLFDKIVRTEQ
jgi:Zn-dependent peptidase ImmA (M78 family)